ncbi:unnamed protein product [Ilex paraguariensis]|uniref:Cytochrome b561 domain-containing protein n=1 Tax=Ilex paraguariensis TaxID=185542 RepID=A0ABC8QWZ1_9AQUA
MEQKGVGNRRGRKRISVTSLCIVNLCMIWFIPSVNAQTSSNGENFPLMNLGRVHVQHGDSHIVPQIHTLSLQNPNSGTIADLRSWRSRYVLHHHRHLRTVHGTVNIIGWGMLLPIGVIIARYYKKLPLQYNEWYSLHILCQVSGFLMGTIGWGLGLSLRHMNKHHAMSTHGILGTIIFTFATIQVLAICLQPREEHKCRKFWVIYHQLLGYALIVLIVANIFEGIDNQSPAKKWKLSYVAILGVLALIALALELLRWMIFHHSAAPTSAIE